ncbi:hypothetical protein AAFF_G00412300 [Aldrovandia affinis]|uniref:Uncharacterized protein n=1 Tax=Aldrovandia affinis TaxID=143900 RepID=A0AAD7SC08_9TELE|nr:hypothetical protein AAFF_G00412300 [Aldrovandia affinis]
MVVSAPGQSDDIIAPESRCSGLYPHPLTAASTLSVSCLLRCILRAGRSLRHRKWHVFRLWGPCRVVAVLREGLRYFHTSLTLLPQLWGDVSRIRCLRLGNLTLDGRGPWKNDRTAFLGIKRSWKSGAGGLRPVEC